MSSQPKSHPNGGGIGIYHTVVVNTIVVAESNGSIVSLVHAKENVDGIWREGEGGRGRERERQGETGREREREGERETGRERERDRDGEGEGERQREMERARRSK